MPTSGFDSNPLRKTRTFRMTATCVAWTLGLAFLLAPAAVAQPGSDQGQELYEQNCALCHRDSGAGNPPTFPALNGNDLLGNTARLVRSIHTGGSGLPPFPTLTAEDIAALGNYLRNAWTNALGRVTTEDVAATTTFWIRYLNPHRVLPSFRLQNGRLLVGRWITATNDSQSSLRQPGDGRSIRAHARSVMAGG